MFTGNQIAGYDTAYANTFRKRRWGSGLGLRKPVDRRATERRESDLEHTRELVRGTIAQFLQPLIDRRLPWAVTYGNHDFQCGLDNAELDAIYREFPECVNPESTAASPLRARKVPCAELPDQIVYPYEPGTFHVADVRRWTHAYGVGPGAVGLRRL